MILFVVVLPLTHVVVIRAIRDWNAPETRDMIANWIEFPKAKFFIKYVRLDDFRFSGYAMTEIG